MNNPRLAKDGERLAAEFLVHRGMVVVEKNYRCPIGEVDIILLDGDVLVFCEVKTRSNLDYGYPLEAINSRKINRLIKIASFYIGQQRIEHRIDAVGIYYLNGEPQIDWIKNCTM